MQGYFMKINEQAIPNFSWAKTLSGTLLIGGTCIGAGMLALPIVTGIAGFYPAMIVNTLCWLFMMATGLLLLEATLAMPEGANFLSISSRFLGPIGKWVCGGAFFFLYYCFMVAYITGGTPIVSTLLKGLGIILEGNLAYILFTAAFASIIFLGTRLIDRINWILMAGLIISYLLLVGAGSSQVSWDNFSHQAWGLSLLAAPTLFGAYGYHNVIPSVASYLKNNAFALRIAIIVGTTIPYVVYSVWQWMIIGTVPVDMIQQAAVEGTSVTQALQSITGHPWISAFGLYFGFFALVTSLIGVGLSMVDFLADGLEMNVTKPGFKRLLLCLLVFIPPLLLSIGYPHIFLEAIGIAGGFGEAILNGIFPIAIVWIGRYKMGILTSPQVAGKKLMLLALLAITVLIMALEFKHLFL